MRTPTIGRMAAIVLAEDDVKQAELVRRYLEREHHTVTVVGDGRAALEEVRRAATRTCSCST